MKYADFVKIPNGTQVLNHGFDQCVAVANLYHESVIGGEFVPVASAYQWWTSFGAYPTLLKHYTPSNTPVAGAIFVSRYGLYDAPNGHIGVVTKVNPNGTFNTIEQNAGTWRYKGTYVRDMQNMLGFLIPKNNPAAPKSTPEPTTRKVKDMFLVYYKNGNGKGKPGWLIFGAPELTVLSTAEKANAVAKLLGNAIVEESDAGWKKWLIGAGATAADLKKHGA